MNETLQDFFLCCKDCVLENPQSFYGSFSLGPFKNSQSLTIANALRRTLLTEISNIAITHVEIDGVLHEYSTIDGVRESVFDILLNFKQIVLKTSLPFSKPVYGYLNVRGPGIVRASDLKLPPNIQYVDPDQYIATLNENGNLSLKFIISNFCNSTKQKILPDFLTNFENFQKKEKFGFEENTPMSKFKIKKTNSLWVDPNFNPILKVNYFIENFEPIIQNFQYQVIHIEIWTNGSLHPRNALYFTFDFLKNIFNKFDDMKYINNQYNHKFFESEEPLNKILKNYEYDYSFYNSMYLKKQKVSLNSAHFLQNNPSQKYLLKENSFTEQNTKENRDKNFEKNQLASLETLHLSTRITHSLKKKNLLTIIDILNFSPKELKNFCGFGNFSIYLIQKKLKKQNFFLKDEKDI